MNKLENINTLPEPWSYGKFQASQILKWLPCDTEEYFNKNMEDPEYRKYAEEQGWLVPDAISYRINKHGFRGPEFVDGEPCLVTLGCSFTVGIGLAEHVIWPSLVGRALGLPVYNLSWGGTGADTCYRLARYWIPKLKPARVCMLAPPPARIELLTDPSNRLSGQYHQPAETFLPSSESGYFNPNDIFLKHWFLNDENAKINNEKNKMAIKGLCAEYNIPYHIHDAFTFMAKSHDEVGYARDRMHAGTIAHQAVANKILSEV